MAASSPNRVCLLIPVYNHERALGPLLEQLRASGLPCILVDDASDEASARVLDGLAQREAAWVTLVRHAQNQGKGAAVLTGARAAQEKGFTHVLQLDADGQHRPEDVPAFLAALEEHPDAMVLGEPRFDASAPRSRLWGRQLTNVWVWVNTLSLSIEDGLCGYRLYPVEPLLRLAEAVPLGKRMDFDPEVAVRLKWEGLRVVGVPVQVGYPQDGVSHFRMGADNWLISRMHARLFFGMLRRLPRRLPRRLLRLLFRRRAPASRAQKWSDLQEVGTARGMAFLYWVYRWFGRAPFRVVLYPVLLWFFLFQARARQASLQFLSRALGRPATWREGLRHFMTFAEAILDKLIAWNDGFRLEDVDFRGREHLAELLANKKGFILIGAHLGNMEICRVLSKWRPGLELHVLVHTVHAASFNRTLQRLDPRSQMNIYQVTSFDAGLAAWMSSRVDAGAIVVIAGDRVPVQGGHVTRAPFLGAPAAFPEGPYLLAHALGCPVLLFFCLRNGKRFQVDFELFRSGIRLPRGQARREAVTSLAADYAKRLEAYAVQSPFQWFNFYHYWPST
jgi:predicted LPLAT superfamily acyltransferase